MSVPLGIDLGTSNSCGVAIIDGAPQPALEPNGSPITPSIVAITSDDKFLSGTDAKQYSETAPERCIYAAKRIIGRAFDTPEVKNAAKNLFYPILQGQNEDARIEINRRLFSPVEIAAIILRRIKQNSERTFGQTAKEAVITVPAYFNDGQRQATKDAGRVADLDVIRLINEPTAASLAYGFGDNADGVVLVYDLGGGTFDVSVLEIRNNVFEVLATNGDSYLGGVDFDNRILSYIVTSFINRHGVDLRQDRGTLNRLRNEVERAKILLSTKQEAEIFLDKLPTSLGYSGNLDLLITAGNINQACEELLLRTVEICRATLEQAALAVSDIDEVILIGGQTKMPRIVEVMSDLFQRTITHKFDPDLTVAIGAAIQAQNLVSTRKSHAAASTDCAPGRRVCLVDVTPLSLGIVAAGGLVSKLIPRNSKVPSTVSEIFTTTRENQDAVRISVVQGESIRADENVLLGEFTLVGIRRAAAGVPQIEVSFSIDANGILSAKARDVDTAIEQSIAIRAHGGLGSDEIERLQQFYNQSLPPQNEILKSSEGD
jgi:molecular chaperone DnaK